MQWTSHISLKPRARDKPGPYDIALVEGSVTTPHEIERIKEIRQEQSF